MLDLLNKRAERIGVDAVERARQRIIGELDEPGVRLNGRRLSERLWWIGGLFR